MMNAFKSNPKEFTDYIKELKINKPLGVEIPGETSPRIAEPGSKSWSPVSLPWMSIGYEVTLTPLQLLTIYNGVANDGEMLKPYFVKAIGQKGEIEKRFKPIVINDEMASKSTLKKVRALLKGVVDSGTARNISNSRIEIAGKTGTARISDGKAYSEGDYNSSFAGYFPADKPVYSIIVVINKPREGGYFGGVVAGPIVKEIAEKILGTQQHTGSELADSLTDLGTLPIVIAGKKSRAVSFLDNFTDYDFDGDADNTDWVSARKDSVTNYAYALLSESQNVLPNLTGMGLRDALYYLENKKIRVTYSGKGSVYWQSVEPGSKIVKGSSIYLKLRTGW
jgi:cell division protein FtsI (penicillin-binding protein 3)